MWCELVPPPLSVVKSVCPCQDADKTCAVSFIGRPKQINSMSLWDEMSLEEIDWLRVPREQYRLKQR